ncbi:MAG: hypothetical protein KDD46_05345 [Bdellovibrionales bacterium]|nr:hypothetical protein [Bdellovibrionales bacterium]
MSSQTYASHTTSLQQDTITPEEKNTFILRTFQSINSRSENKQDPLIEHLDRTRPLTIEAEFPVAPQANNIEDLLEYRKQLHWSMAGLFGILMAEVFAFQVDQPILKFFTAQDHLILAHEEGLKKYFTTTNPSIKTGTKALNSFTSRFQSIVFDQVNNNLTLQWKSQGVLQTKTLSPKNFRILMMDIAKYPASSFTSYMDDFVKYGEKFLFSSTDEMLELKLVKFGKQISNLLRKRQVLKVLRWGSVIGLGILIYVDYTIVKEIEEALPNLTPESLNDMIENDPHEIQAYFLDPFPEFRDALYDYLKSIPSGVIDFHAFLQN